MNGRRIQTRESNPNRRGLGLLLVLGAVVVIGGAIRSMTRAVIQRRAEIDQLATALQMDLVEDSLGALSPAGSGDREIELPRGRVAITREALTLIRDGQRLARRPRAADESDPNTPAASSTSSPNAEQP